MLLNQLFHKLILQMILFEFIFLDIESKYNEETYTSKCYYDYLTIHDGGSESDILLGKYCVPMSYGQQLIFVIS